MNGDVRYTKYSVVYFGHGLSDVRHTSFPILPSTTNLKTTCASFKPPSDVRHTFIYLLRNAKLGR